jgi:hypothetical protein
MAPLIEIITANRLRDGAVVYWKQGGWTVTLADADQFADRQACTAALALAKEQVAAGEVVNPYRFEARQDNTIAIPVKERELIRASGPSIHPELGKKADPATAPRFHIAAPAKPPRPKQADGPEAFDVSL